MSSSSELHYERHGESGDKARTTDRALLLTVFLSAVVMAAAISAPLWVLAHREGSSAAACNTATLDRKGVTAALEDLPRGTHAPAFVVDMDQGTVTKTKHAILTCASLINEDAYNIVSFVPVDAPTVLFQYDGANGKNNMTVTVTEVGVEALGTTITSSTNTSLDNRFCIEMPAGSSIDADGFDSAGQVFCCNVNRELAAMPVVESSS